MIYKRISASGKQVPQCHSMMFELVLQYFQGKQKKQLDNQSPHVIRENPSAFGSEGVLKSMMFEWQLICKVPKWTFVADFFSF